MVNMLVCKEFIVNSIFNVEILIKFLVKRVMDFKEVVVSGLEIGYKFQVLLRELFLGFFVFDYRSLILVDMVYFYVNGCFYNFFFGFFEMLYILQGNFYLKCYLRIFCGVKNNVFFIICSFEIVLNGYIC